MNLNSIITMITKIFVRKATDAAIDYASRRGKPAKDLTPAENLQASKAREMTKRARKAARVTRRIGR